MTYPGEPLQRIVLALEGNDMEVNDGTAGLFDRRGIVPRGPTPQLEQTANQIVFAFELTRR